MPVSYTGQVYSGQAEWNTTTGYWRTAANWKDTVGGGPSGAPGLSGFITDTATFGPNEFSGIVVVALNSAAPVLSNLVFRSSNASYWIFETGTTGLTLTSSNGITPAAVTVISGTHSVDASILLQSNVVVSSSGCLTFSQTISESGGSQSLTLAGAGELIRSGNDTYTGGTNVAAGTLVITSNTALPTGTRLAVGAAGTFIFDPSAAGSSLTSSASAVAVPNRPR